MLESDLGPLQKKQLLLTAEPFIQPLSSFLMYKELLSQYFKAQGYLGQSVKGRAEPGKGVPGEQLFVSQSNLLWFKKQ